MRVKLRLPTTKQKVLVLKCSGALGGRSIGSYLIEFLSVLTPIRIPSRVLICIYMIT